MKSSVLKHILILVILYAHISCTWSMTRDAQHMMHDAWPMMYDAGRMAHDA